MIVFRVGWWWGAGVGVAFNKYSRACRLQASLPLDYLPTGYCYRIIIIITGARSVSGVLGSVPIETPRRKECRERKKENKFKFTQRTRESLLHIKSVYP